MIKGPFIASRSGSFIGPYCGAPTLEDAVVASGRISRFAGHGKDLYSVLVHSLVVMDLAPERAKLWALIHDCGTESVISDIPSPFKIAEMRELEERMYLRILKDWKIPYPTKQVLADVHSADLEALAGEAWVLGPPLLKTVEPFKRRSRRAEKLVHYYIKKYPPSDTIRADGRAVKEFIARFRKYKNFLGEN